MSTIRTAISAPLAAVLAMALVVEGCTSWRAAPVAPEALAQTRPAAVRVVRRDGTRETLLSPQFTADSMIGKGEPGRGARVAVAFSDAQGVEVRRSDALKSAGAAMGVVIGATALVGMMVLATWDGPFGH